MQRPYELIFIVQIDPNEEVIRASIDQVQQWVEEDDNGSVTRADHWGRRKLAYEVDGQREGYYVLFDANIEGDHLDELEQNLKLSAEVLRYLLIRKEDQPVAKEAEAQVEE